MISKYEHQNITHNITKYSDLLDLFKIRIRSMVT